MSEPEAGGRPGGLPAGSGAAPGRAGAGAGGRDVSAGDPVVDVLGLLRLQQLEMEPPELTAAQIAALPLAGDEPPAEAGEPWWLAEEFYGSDAAEQESWLRGLPADVRAAYERGRWTGAGEAWGAGFLHHDEGDGPAGPGFAAGGWSDVMAPGPALAAVTAAADQRRARLGESELIGVLCGWQRLVSWAQAGQAGCLSHLVQRRKAQSVELRRPSLAGHVDDEVAAALALTGRGAGRLLEVAVGLARLPEVLAALAAGRIDWARAALFTDYLAGLPAETAGQIAAAVLAAAGRRTPGQLRAALIRAVLAYDPESAQQRREAARADASVRAWPEPSGNAALAGRELPAADVVHASAQLTSCARWLREHGAAGTLDQLRAAAYLALLTGRPLHSLLPAAAGPGYGDADGNPGDAGHADDAALSDAGLSDAGSPAAGSPGPGAGSVAAGSPGAGFPAAGSPGAGSPVLSAQLTGSINLTMPVSAWLGDTDRPGELAGYGPADAATCRDLARRAGPGTRWCLTLTTGDGRAVAHACAPAGPPPGSGTGPGAMAWADGLCCKLEFLETGPCRHPRRTARYMPPRALRHLICIRQPTCAFPGCRRPARRCDLDHTTPYDQGGMTCECNLAPACRRHHQAKQAYGWHLQQDQPGQMTWTLPSGRTYHTTGDSHPV